MNPVLRMAVEKARAANMPSDNIERAIKRGSGGDDGEALVGFLCEAFGPGNIAVLVDGITDNMNRSLAEVRKIVTSSGGRMADPGSVQWMFDRKGYLRLMAPETLSADEAQLVIIDAGADDLESRVDGLIAYTAPDKLMETKKKAEDAGMTVSEIGFEYVPKNPASFTDEKVRGQFEKFYEALDDHDDVQEVFVNLGA